MTSKMDTIKEFRQIFKEKEVDEIIDCERDEEIPVEERKGYMDPANICAWVPK